MAYFQPGQQADRAQPHARPNVPHIAYTQVMSLNEAAVFPIPPAEQRPANSYWNGVSLHDEQFRRALYSDFSEVDRYLKHKGPFLQNTTGEQSVSEMQKGYVGLYKFRVMSDGYVSSVVDRVKAQRIVVAPSVVDEYIFMMCPSAMVGVTQEVTPTGESEMRVFSLFEGLRFVDGCSLTAFPDVTGKYQVPEKIGWDSTKNLIKQLFTTGSHDGSVRLWEFRKPTLPCALSQTPALSLLEIVKLVLEMNGAADGFHMHCGVRPTVAEWKISVSELAANTRPNSQRSVAWILDILSQGDDNLMFSELDLVKALFTVLDSSLAVSGEISTRSLSYLRYERNVGRRRMIDWFRVHFQNQPSVIGQRYKPSERVSMYYGARAEDAAADLRRQAVADDQQIALWESYKNVSHARHARSRSSGSNGATPAVSPRRSSVDYRMVVDTAPPFNPMYTASAPPYQQPQPQRPYRPYQPPPQQEQQQQQQHTPVFMPPPNYGGNSGSTNAMNLTNQGGMYNNGGASNRAYMGPLGPGRQY